MGAIFAGDILKVTVVCQGLQGQVALPSVHYVVGITVGAPQDQDMANAIDAFVAATYLPLMANTASYVGTIAQVIFPLPVQQRVVANVAVGPGTGGATPMAQQVAPIISFATPLTGPAQRGRWFQPFVPDNIISGLTGELINTYKATLQNWASFLLTLATIGAGANVAAVNLCIFHRDSGTFDIVSSAKAERLVGTQKRRGNFGKQNVSPI